MNKPPKEWLEFLREQYPKGSRVRLTEMGSNPKPVPPGSTGTLEYIDDLGAFHVNWDSGRSLVLALGEDRFTVQPPELTTLKLYMPMAVGYIEPDEWGGWHGQEQFLDNREAIRYADVVVGALYQVAAAGQKARGLMHYYDKDDSINRKVQSYRFTAEVRTGRLWGVAECLITESLTAEELSKLKETVAGQASDGFGEGMEQHAIDVGGRELHVHLWQWEGWSIQTEAERFGPRQAQELHNNGAPAEAQRSGFGGERSSGEMSEPCPQGEAKDMKHGTTMTMGGMSLG